MFDWIYSPEAWIALATLTSLEIVLGIDNIIFISILVSRLPERQRDFARRLGLGLAMVTRLALLFSLTWVMGLTDSLFSVFGQGISGRDLILVGGGLFLLAKATHEIHNSLEGESEAHSSSGTASMGMILVQIAILDVVFSLDSVITAVGLADQIMVMAIAIVIAVGVMLFSAKAIGEFVDSHPTVKMLALSFLVLVGMTLIAEGFEVHIPKGYVYFAMAFSVAVEMLNLKMRKRRAEPVKLRKPIE
ncbi:TerC family protein [Ferrimonas balearica]|uniref:TerC family protein n=1 Tax=Ferrimonas balearica TaxID=44012 RepID=UPI001C99D1F4|nr:TerC family protein [Ferrimonas balearica]MBY5992363.1 TerC family protein [Ferrimonas balearica]